MNAQVKRLLPVTFSIAIPIALQSLVGFAVNMMDTVMLGQLGDVMLSASSLANQVFFIVSLAIGGIASGANVLVAQAWGKHDIQKIHRVLAYTYRMALGLVLVVSALALIFPRPIMSIFTTDAEVITQGTVYLKIIAWSYLFYGLTAVTTGVLRAVHTVKIAMFGSALAMVVNVFLNWVLIFGKLGAPKMGIAGAALATLIARICEFLLILWFVYRKEDKIGIRIRKLIPTDRSLLKPYLATSMPVIINEVFWALGESVLAMILGRMGTEVVAANSICSVMNQLANVLVQGATAATCVIIGNTIGAGKLDELPVQKRYFQIFAVTMGLLAGLLIFVTRGPIIGFYNVTETTRIYASQLILITAIIQPFQAFQITNMMGVLRGGGDVKFAMMNDLIFLWCVTLPLGFLTGLVLHCPVWLVFCCLRIEKIGKGITSELRLRKGKWVHNMVADSSVSDAPSGEAAAS